MEIDAPILSFEPLPWQKRFLMSRKKSPWAIGGNRSGKSEIGAFKMATHLVGFCPVTGRVYEPGKYWAVGLDFPQVDQVMRPKIERYIGKVGRDYTWHAGKQLIAMNNGAQLWFKSCDSGRQKFQGADLDGVWFDEEPPFEIYKETWTRTIDRAGFVAGTMTPLKGSAWLYQNVYSAKDDDKFEVISMAMTDNKYLPKDEIEGAKSMYRDEDEIAVRVQGRYLLVFGRPVLHVRSLQEIRKTFVRAPRFRGRLVSVEVN